MSSSLTPSSPYTGSRSLSRSSSRNSFSTRNTSPPLLEDPVAVRNQMSTLKHNIRHQQAQLHNLENIILRGPRPLPPGVMGSPPHTPDEPDTGPFTAHAHAHTPSLSNSNSHSHGHGHPHAHAQASSPLSLSMLRVGRRSSFEVLQGLAGPESSLPLPRRDDAMRDGGGIREGVPMDFGGRSVSPNGYKRASSPTRTLSRIPVASVGNARALADEGQARSPTIDAHTSSSSGGGGGGGSGSGGGSGGLSGGSLQPPSPNGQPTSPSGASASRRISLTPGGTTKVLADLQTGVVNARNALENTRAQLRLSQRSVAQLTRQTEDLKEGRERLRLENEGLNNVVARKERLLQEVLERARKAETEATALKAQLKAEQGASKKTLREMESALAESTALSQRAEREYATLRESVRGLVEGWRAETEGLRGEMHAREERCRAEGEEVGRRYRVLLEEVAREREGRGTVARLREEEKGVREEMGRVFGEEIARLREDVERSGRECEEALGAAKETADELARLRRLIQSGRRLALTEEGEGDEEGEEHQAG